VLRGAPAGGLAARLVTGLVAGLVSGLVSGLAVFGLLVAPPARAEEPAPGAPLPAVVAAYIDQGMHSNLALQNQSLELQRSHAALEAARARFLPEVTMNARYTRAEGGRQFTIPVSQLLNPAYQTLNELLVAQGQAPRFPAVSDVSFPLQLPREQDTRLSLRQPLYAPAIAAGARAAAAQNDASGYSLAAYRNELRRDIAIAYLNWLKARTASDIVESGLTLLTENLRVNDALYREGKLTVDQVERARAELYAVQQQQREADNSALQGQRYVNFLLNRGLDTALVPAVLEDGPVVNAGSSPDGSLLGVSARAQEQPGADRPELQQLAASIAASNAQLDAARAARQPALSLGVDAGTEGEDYRFGRGYNFVTGSLLFSWTVFDGGARTAAIDQARSASRQLANLRAQTQSRIELEVLQARDNLKLAVDSYDTALARAVASRETFRIVSRKRDEGIASQVEFLDARNTLSNAELNLNLTRFDGLIRRAEYEYATAAGEP
jgi:outer membrane protein TolC